MDVIAQFPSITVLSYNSATGGNGTYNISNPHGITLNNQQCSAGQRWDLATSGAQAGPQAINTVATFTGGIPVISGQVATGAFVQPDAIMSTGLHGGGAPATNQNLSMSFYHTGSRVEVCGSGAGSKYQWYINDRPLFAQAVIVSGTSCQQLNFGSVARRLVKVSCWNCGFGNINTDITDIVVKAAVRGMRIVGYFDSLGGGAMTAGSTVDDFLSILCSRLGADDCIPIYAGGTGFVANNNGASPTFAEHTRDATVLNGEIIVIGTGVNDQSLDPTAVYNSAVATFSAFRNAQPDAVIIFLGYRQQGPLGGSNPWTPNSLNVWASIKAAAALYNVVYLNPNEPDPDTLYGTVGGDSAQGSITGYITPGTPDTLNVVTSAIYLYPGNLVSVGGQQIAIATAPGGGGAGAYTLASSGVSSGSVGTPLAYPVAWGATLAAGTSVGATTLQTANAPPRGAVLEIEDGASTERVQIIDYNSSTNYISTFDGSLRFTHAAGTYIRQVGTSYMYGHGNVGSETLYGPADRLTTTDGTHPTPDGGYGLGWAALTQFMQKTAPNN